MSAVSVAPVGVVTDSTASLPPELARDRGITVVPLQVVIGGAVHDEGVAGGVDPEDLAEALRQWTPVSTSRPNPDALLEVYEKLAADGAEAIVSVHLSSELSGTYESAQLAARRSPVPVVTVDSRQVGMGTGYAVLAAADAVAAGATAQEAAEAARHRAAATTSLFYVDTLEYLRRGGRMGAAAALIGSALAVKPILKVVEGRVGSFEKVRTSAKALQRLEELAVEAAGDLPGRRGGRAPRQPPSGASSWPTGWPSGWPTSWRAARSPWARSGPSSAPTSAPGWSRSPSRRATERPPQPHPPTRLSTGSRSALVAGGRGS